MAVKNSKCNSTYSTEYKKSRQKLFLIDLEFPVSVFIDMDLQTGYYA